MTSALLLLSACVALDSSLTLEPANAPAAPAYLGVAYVDDGEPKHTLDIYLPREAEARLPTLLVIHGTEDTKESHKGLAGYFAERGYAVVLAEYRYPNEPGRPLMLQDAFCSLAWVHANAETYGFDRDRIFVFGFSLGGLIAATLGAVDDTSQFMEGCPNQLLQSSRTRGVATYAAMLGTPEVCLSESWCLLGAALGNKIPMTQMLPIAEALKEIPPSSWRDNIQLSEEAISFAQTLPLYWVDGSEPAFLLVHGSDDALVPPTESEAFGARLQSAGVDTGLVLVPGAGHQSIYPRGPSFTTIVEALEGFFATNLEQLQPNNPSLPKDGDQQANDDKNQPHD